MHMVRTINRTPGRRALAAAFEAILDGQFAAARARLAEARNSHEGISVEADVLEGLVLHSEGRQEAAQVRLEEAGWRSVCEARLRQAAAV